MIVKVSSKYQVVIPEHVREVLQLKPGTQVEVIAKGSTAYIVPIRDLKSIKKDFKGRLDSRGLREKKDRLK